MAQLSPSTGLTKTNPTATTILLTWTKAPDYAIANPFGYRFVQKGNPAVIYIPTQTETGTPTDGGATMSVTFTFADAPTTTKYYTDYIAEVQTLNTATPADNSPWCIERYWVVAPTLTITIGSASYTLTRDTFSSNGGLYKLPASADNPITILYTDMKTFVESLPGGLTLPTTYPNGDTIGASLNIYELIVDTTNGLFSLSISVVLNWAVIPLLTINKLGLVLKRTDGSI